MGICPIYCRFDDLGDITPVLFSELLEAAIDLLVEPNVNLYRFHVIECLYYTHLFKSIARLYIMRGDLTRQINVRLEQSTIDQINQLIQEGEFYSMAEFLRYAAIQTLKRYEGRSPPPSDRGMKGAGP